MSTLAEVEAAADSLPIQDQESLLVHLTEKLRGAGNEPSLDQTALVKKAGLWVIKRAEGEDVENALERMRDLRSAELFG